MTSKLSEYRWHKREHWLEQLSAPRPLSKNLTNNFAEGLTGSVFDSSLFSLKRGEKSTGAGCWLMELNYNVPGESWDSGFFRGNLVFIGNEVHYAKKQSIGSRKTLFFEIPRTFALQSVQQWNWSRDQFHCWTLFHFGTVAVILARNSIFHTDT